MQYQLIHIGNKSPFLDKIIGTFYKQVDELGMDRNVIELINSDNFNSNFKGNSPSYTLYFGHELSEFKDTEILIQLDNNACLILPIVSEITAFKSQVPDVLHGINGYELNSDSKIESLVSSILEGLGLLRLSRRIFISYKRDESSTIAIQLFEHFEKKGFDVFLDTHSVRAGDQFQEELWHRLADTDVVVLLNTSNFLDSYWTKEELAQANAMSIGVLQLIWPAIKLKADAQLSIPIQLENSDFGNQKYTNPDFYFSDASLSDIIQSVETLRARSLASRQANIISEFVSTAKKLCIAFNLQPNKFITIENRNREEVIVIPAVGVPHAFTYNQSQELVKQIKKDDIKELYLLFDHRNIRERWLNHLAWLDNYLPVKTKKIVDVESWLKNI